MKYRLVRAETELDKLKDRIKREKFSDIEEKEDHKVKITKQKS